MIFDQNFKKVVLLLVIGLLYAILPVWAQVQQNETKADSTAISTDSLQVAQVDSTLKNPPKPSILRIAKPYQRNKSKLIWIQGAGKKESVTYDSTGYYVSKRQIGEYLNGEPYYMQFDRLAKERLQSNTYNNWHRLAMEQSRKEYEDGGLLDFSLRIPGGTNSTFSTIFGSDEVNLRITGNANLTLGANIKEQKNPNLAENQQKQVDPIFEQALKFNIQGTIGDKLSITTDWDTENQFEYENRLRISYEGYEDEIIKNIEIGNVSINTGNSLISGGSALFGIKSVAELGKLRVSSVLSQQRGESKAQTISGGSTENENIINPTDYEDDKYFFIDFFNRQEYEDAVSDPTISRQILQISKIYVYALSIQNNNSDQLIDAVAMVDYGVVANADGSFGRPDTDADNIDDAVVDQFRTNIEATPSADDFGVQADEFVSGKFQELTLNSDYTFNAQLGYIRLKRQLGANQALAVAFTYQSASGVEQVGDIPSPNTRAFFKLIRPQDVTSSNKAWDLTMRNVYSLPATNITRDNIELEIAFSPDNQDRVTIAGRSTDLLEDLGLDRINQNNDRVSDDFIDFGTTTFDAQNGTIIFPYLEPFGDRMRNLIETSTLNDAQKEEFINQYVFDDLYTRVPSISRQNSKNNFFRIKAKVKGAVEDTYPLNDFSVVQGSVKVRAGGVTLVEGVDYTVDYALGIVNITNKQYLSGGQEVTIEYESNQAFQVQQKSFMGFRAEYDVARDIQVGATLFRYKEQPNQDKIRIGNEQINNTIIGLDAKADFDLPWLTRMVDKLPLLQTKELSSISFDGAFAQLRPGIAQTPATEKQIKSGDLYDDEENGLSFIDDFEGVENTFSFLSPQQWRLASSPAAIPGREFDKENFDEDIDPFEDVLNPETNDYAKFQRNDLRSQFSWYAIDPNLSSIGQNRPAEARVIPVNEVFPQRDTRNAQDQQNITTLDVYYNPSGRGQYNYNDSLKTVLEEQPYRTWGGMVAPLGSGYQNLTKNNFEFLEFWVSFVLPNGEEPTPDMIEDYAGQMYVDIGLMSEDVVPNSTLNSEDGLASRLTDENFLKRDHEFDDLDSRSYIPRTPPEIKGEFSNTNRKQEDVGLDGVPSFLDPAYTQQGLNEQELFAEWIDRMRESYGESSPEFEAILADPSNDDYNHYNEFGSGSYAFQERFYRMFGYYEGNSDNTTPNRRAITNKPDTEGLKNPNGLNENNSYFEYQLNINPADTSTLSLGENFVVDQVQSQTHYRKWYQVRIPLSDITRKFGNITDFQNVSYVRVWMSGYRKPFTMRFATFEFVGSQWFKEGQETGDISELVEGFYVNSVNIEENGSREPIPYRQPKGSIRAINRSQQQQTLTNEQSLSLRVEDLRGGETKFIRRVFPTAKNLLNYSNMRMFVHGEGFEQRGDLELVVRMGQDLNNNYYEYRQPITPSNRNFNYGNLGTDDNSIIEADAEEVWKYDENSMNIVLSAFNQLKQIRDDLELETGVVRDSLERSDVLTDAVPGAVVKIKGNPSLQNVTIMGLGLRNPGTINNAGQEFISGEVWLNELRVSGFDNKKGWGAIAKTTLKLADFATLNVSYNRKTDGFGSIDSRISDRSMNDVANIDLSASISLHKLIPSRFGWKIPLALKRSMSITNPRFLPQSGGDIRVQEAIDAIRNNQTIDGGAKDSLINNVKLQSETYRETNAISLTGVSKQYSKGFLGKVLLDRVNLNYSYNNNFLRSPTIERQEGWSYSFSGDYSYGFSNIKLFEPFRFLDEVPILKHASGFGIGYMPSSIAMNIKTTRNYSESLRRNLDMDNGSQAFATQAHSFGYNTGFRLNYQFTRSIQTSFASSSQFDLSVAGQDMIDSLRYDLVPSTDVFGDLVTGEKKPRRSTYKEDYTANWKPRFNTMKALRWLSLQSTFRGGFQWTNNSSATQNLGATLQNSYSINHTPSVDFQGILDMIPFYEGMKKADKTSEGKRKQYKDRKKREKERVDKLRKRREEAIARGDKVNEEEKIVEKEIVVEGLESPLKFYTRKLILALTSLQNVNLTYNIQKNSSQAGYSGGALIFNAFNTAMDDSYSPNLGYRLGLKNNVNLDQLILQNDDLASGLSIGFREQTTKNFKVGTKIQPLKGFSISLDWNNTASESSTNNLTIEDSQSQQYIRAVTENGSYQSSAWSFGKGYEELFYQQLQTAFDDIQNDTLADGNGDGRNVLSRSSVREDAIGAYMHARTKTSGRFGFNVLPLPNWDVTWSGVEKLLPFEQSFITSITLSHSFKGIYKLQWDFLQDTQTNTSDLSGITLINQRGNYDATSLTVTKNYMPLIKANFVFKSGIRADVQYDKSITNAISFSSNVINESVSDGVRVNFGYTIKRLKLPFFKRLRNSLDIQVNTGINTNTQQKYTLLQDVKSALETYNNTEGATTNARDYLFTPNEPTGDKRITASVTMGYSLSNSVKAKFSYNYTEVNPLSSGLFPSKTHGIAFNLNVNIRSR